MLLYAWMSACTLASRPVSRFLIFIALPCVISAIGASSLLDSIPSQTPGVQARFACRCGVREKTYPIAGPANSIQGETDMAKLKKAPGRLIGRWKQEAIAANAGA